MTKEERQSRLAVLKDLLLEQGFWHEHVDAAVKALDKASPGGYEFCFERFTQKHPSDEIEQRTTVRVFKKFFNDAASARKYARRWEWRVRRWTELAQHNRLGGGSIRIIEPKYRAYSVNQYWTYHDLAGAQDLYDAFELSIDSNHVPFVYQGVYLTVRSINEPEPLPAK